MEKYPIIRVILEKKTTSLSAPGWTVYDFYEIDNLSGKVAVTLPDNSTTSKMTIGKKYRLVLEEAQR